MKKEEKQRYIVARLFDYAGKHKYFTIIGAILIGLTSLTGILPLL